jgi:hypothetical protein
MNIKNMAYISFFTGILAIILEVISTSFGYIYCFSYHYYYLHEKFFPIILVLGCLSLVLSLVSITTGIKFKNKTKKFDTFSKFGITLSCVYFVIVIIFIITITFILSQPVLD